MEEALINAAVGLVGAGFGGLLSYAGTRRAWRRTLSVEALDDLAQIHDIVWHEVSAVEARKLEGRIRFRLMLLGVPGRLADDMFDAAWDCFRHVAEQEEYGGFGPDGDIGLDRNLKDRFETAQDALVGKLRA